MPKATPKTAKTKPVRLELSPDQHTKLRVLAASKGMPMAQYAREIILDKIEKSGK